MRSLTYGLGLPIITIYLFAFAVLGTLLVATLTGSAWALVDLLHSACSRVIPMLKKTVAIIDSSPAQIQWLRANFMTAARALRDTMIAFVCRRGLAFNAFR